MIPQIEDIVFEKTVTVEIGKYWYHPPGKKFYARTVEGFPDKYKDILKQWECLSDTIADALDSQYRVLRGMGFKGVIKIKRLA